MNARIVALCLASAVGLAGVVLVLSCHYSSEDSDLGVVLDAESENLAPEEIAKWREKFKKLPQHEVDPSNAFLAVETQERMAAIDREIARAVVWRDRHADELIELIRLLPDSHGVKPPPDDPLELRGQRALALKAISTASGRFSNGAPIDRGAEDRLVKVLLEYTSHPDTSTRFVAVHALFQSIDILERPAVLRRIREVRRTDPEDGIVRSIRRREHELRELGWDGHL